MKNLLLVSGALIYQYYAKSNWEMASKISSSVAFSTVWISLGMHKIDARGMLRFRDPVYRIRESSVVFCIQMSFKMSSICTNFLRYQYTKVCQYSGSSAHVLFLRFWSNPGTSTFSLPWLLAAALEALRPCSEDSPAQIRSSWDQTICQSMSQNFNLNLFELQNKVVNNNWLSLRDVYSHQMMFICCKFWFTDSQARCRKRWPFGIILV